MFETMELSPGAGDAGTPGKGFDGEWSGTLRLACIFVVIQFGLHAWFAGLAGDVRILMPHAVAWVLDVFLLGILAGALLGVGVLLPGGRFSRWLWPSAGSILIFLAGLLLASYPGFLTEFLVFPMNVFHADGATAWFFVSEYLGWKGLWPILLSGVVAVMASRTRWDPPALKKLLIGFIPVTLFSVVTLPHPAPQPYVYSLQDSARGWLYAGERAVPSLVRPSGTQQFDDASSAAVPPLQDVETLRYDHILILVFEGVTTARFERRFLTRSRGYYAELRGGSAYFSQYCATNLDSYTSLIAMLTSVQVPFRAYANPAGYETVNEGPNLVAALRRRGFQTLFICTAEHQPFVPVRKDWSRTLGMRDLPRQEGWVRLGGNRVETAVEDRAALPAILGFMKSHAQTVVMQEMVFGHSPRWIAKTGKSQLEYYDEYLQELLEGLEDAGLADRTLLVVVSDHGDRADSANVENYRVPLLISGQGIAPSRISEHLSHRDLPGIIGHFLTGRELPEARESILTVGSTERWVYGEITPNGDYLFIDNDTGSVLASNGIDDAKTTYERFQRQLNAFAARYQR